jgi:hypothetical protein
LYRDSLAKIAKKGFGPIAFGELLQRVHRNQRIPNEHVLIAVGLPKTRDAQWETPRDTSCDFTTRVDFVNVDR